MGILLFGASAGGKREMGRKSLRKLEEMEKHDSGQGIKKRCYYNNNHMREWRVGHKSSCDPPARTVTQLTDLSIEMSAFFPHGVLLLCFANVRSAKNNPD